MVELTLKYKNQLKTLLVSSNPDPYKPWILSKNKVLIKPNKPWVIANKIKIKPK
jgi:hypothetical protein